MSRLTSPAGTFDREGWAWNYTNGFGLDLPVRVQYGQTPDENGNIQARWSVQGHTPADFAIEIPADWFKPDDNGIKFGATGSSKTAETQTSIYRKILNSAIDQIVWHDAMAMGAGRSLSMRVTDETVDESERTESAESTLTRLRKEEILAPMIMGQRGPSKSRQHFKLADLHDLNKAELLDHDLTEEQQKVFKHLQKFELNEDGSLNMNSALHADPSFGAQMLGGETSSERIAMTAEARANPILYPSVIGGNIYYGKLNYTVASGGSVNVAGDINIDFITPAEEEGTVRGATLSIKPGESQIRTFRFPTLFYKPFINDERGAEEYGDPRMEKARSSGNQKRFYSGPKGNEVEEYLQQLYENNTRSLREKIQEYDDNLVEVTEDSDPSGELLKEERWALIKELRELEKTIGKDLNRLRKKIGAEDHVDWSITEESAVGVMRVTAHMAPDGSPFINSQNFMEAMGYKERLDKMREILKMDKGWSMALLKGLATATGTSLETMITLHYLSSGVRAWLSLSMKCFLDRMTMSLLLLRSLTQSLMRLSLQTSSLPITITMVQPTPIQM